MSSSEPETYCHRKKILHIIWDFPLNDEEIQSSKEHTQIKKSQVHAGRKKKKQDEGQLVELLFIAYGQWGNGLDANPSE